MSTSITNTTTAVFTIHTQEPVEDNGVSIGVYISVGASAGVVISIIIAALIFYHKIIFRFRNVARVHPVEFQNRTAEDPVAIATIH